MVRDLDSPARTPRIRKQFDSSVGRFEGVEQVIARIVGITYIMDAARTVTTGAHRRRRTAGGALGDPRRCT